MESQWDHGFWLGTLMILDGRRHLTAKELIMEALCRMPRQLLRVYEATWAQGKGLCGDFTVSQEVTHPYTRIHQRRPEL